MQSPYEEMSGSGISLIQAEMLLQSIRDHYNDTPRVSNIKEVLVAQITACAQQGKPRATAALSRNQVTLIWESIETEKNQKNQEAIESLTHKLLTYVSNYSRSMQITSKKPSNSSRASDSRAPSRSHSVSRHPAPTRVPSRSHSVSRHPAPISTSYFRSTLTHPRPPSGSRRLEPKSKSIVAKHAPTETVQEVAPPQQPNLLPQSTSLSKLTSVSPASTPSKVPDLKQGKPFYSDDDSTIDALAALSMQMQMQLAVALEEQMVADAKKEAKEADEEARNVALMQAKSLGFQVYFIPGDGDCLFNAISQQLRERHNINISGAHLRRIGVAHLRQYPAKYKNAFTGGEPGLRAHCRAMLENADNDRRKWADEVDIQAISDALGISVALIQPAQGRDNPIIYKSQGADARKVFIIYEGGNHYEALSGYPVLDSTKKQLAGYLIDPKTSDSASSHLSSKELQELGRQPLSQVATLYSTLRKPAEAKLGPSSSASSSIAPTAAFLPPVKKEQELGQAASSNTESDAGHYRPSSPTSTNSD